MPVSQCECCGGTCSWSWTEAFEKFGFNDGDGQVETWNVEAVLTESGYDVTVTGWGMHNTVITSIRKDGTEFIPQNDPDVTFGYDDPRGYLPAEIVRLLDQELPDP